MAAYVDDLGGVYCGAFRDDGSRPDGPVDRHRFAVTREAVDHERTT